MKSERELEKRTSLLEVLNKIVIYSWDEEERDFEANGEPENHIFHDLRFLANALREIEILEEEQPAKKQEGK